MFQPPGEVHSDAVGKTAARCFIIEIGNEWTERLRESALPTLTAPIKFDNGSLARLAIKIRRELRETDDATTALAVEGLMLEMLAEAFREQAKEFRQMPPPWLKQAKELLHDRFSENLTLSEIASAVGVHPVYLTSEFRRRFHCSIGEYIRQLRISYVCREISDTDTPLVEIAVAAGFYDQSHFSRTFKKLIGITPAQYRNKYRAS
jgi:AraC family transcriptional regulator